MYIYIHTYALLYKLFIILGNIFLNLKEDANSKFEESRKIFLEEIKQIDDWITFIFSVFIVCNPKDINITKSPAIKATSLPQLDAKQVSKAESLAWIKVATENFVNGMF